MSEPFFDPSYYINRELSWLDFNHRVLSEAYLTSHPLLERVKFLAISSSNLDEFVMIRMSGLQQKSSAGQGGDVSPDGKTAAEQLDDVRLRCRKMQETIGALWCDDLRPALTAAGVHVLDYADLEPDQLLELRDYFEKQIFPILTPLAIDPGHPFPHISNLSMNLAIIVRDPVQGERFARMKIPASLPRLIPCRPLCGADAQPNAHSACYVWLEQVVAANLDTLFPGLDVMESYPFRVTRNADMEIQEDEASDLLRTIEEGLRQRHFGAAARLELSVGMPEDLRALLISNLLVSPEDVNEMDRPLGLADLMDLLKADRPDLKDVPMVAHIPSVFGNFIEEANGSEIFAAIGEQDIFLHHPYDSFRPVIAFIEGAAQDPNVRAIKQTLYRVGPRSPIVRALAQARDDDTQVAVLVELKARFDEENNIEWARALEDSGVHVVYGLLGLKTHCKLALIVRKEADGLRRYLHLGTGNYNSATARVYTDFSLLTASPDLTSDVSDLFNLLTGYSRQAKYRKLLVAPVNMRERLVALIRNEAEQARAGRVARLIFKMNALVDPEMIFELYEASKAGVKIDMIVRGICCLRPQVPGLSETIRVVSVIGRFLEHSRAYYFENGGDGEPALYLGSADLMQRNLDRRVEVLFPIEKSALRDNIRDEILETTFNDTAKAWELQSDSAWRRVVPSGSDMPLSAQEHFMEFKRAESEAEASVHTEVQFIPASIYPPLPI